MVLYNVTMSLDPAIENDWISWMREKHIPDVLDTGFFMEARLSRVHGEEEGGVTYAISYVAYSSEHLDTYRNEHSPALQEEHNSRFGGKFAAFRTTLSIIEEFRR